jgi:hypothetical protein
VSMQRDRVNKPFIRRSEGAAQSQSQNHTMLSASARAL